jgi:hypothetical protein
MDELFGMIADPKVVDEETGHAGVPIDAKNTHVQESTADVTADAIADEKKVEAKHVESK